MNALVTLVAVTGLYNTAPERIRVRALEPDDLLELASLHRHAYADRPGQGAGNPAWIGPSLDEGHGTAEAASLVASGPDGHITAAIIITERDGEAVIDELFTHPDHRRQGLAEELLRHCMHLLHTLGRPTVTVTVEDNNPAAMALYLSRDFRRLTDDDPVSDYD
jgi:ribosomal protein S18 acetylase RimI-like enzyme